MTAYDNQSSTIVFDNDADHAAAVANYRRLVANLHTDQLYQLENFFEQNRNPTEPQLDILAAEVGLDEKTIRIWYEQRLSAWRVTQGLGAYQANISGR